VFLVEDHSYFRAGLRQLLEAHDDGIRVVGESDSAEDALMQIPDLAPDVVLMDMHLPELSGTEVIRNLATTAPVVRVLVLSGSADDKTVLDAILAGARGYLVKASPIADIVDGIKTAANGGSVLSPGVAAQLLDHIRNGAPQVPAQDGAAAAELTPRELEVLRLMATGMENSQIAERLVISPRTAQNHVASILQKLQMENRIQAAVFAVKHGLA